jgi:hypothetical protein
VHVYVCLFGVSAVLCAGSSLATGSSPVHGVLPTVYTIKELKKMTKVHKDCRATDR